MVALAEMGIVHRDLATRNVLVFAFDRKNYAVTVVKVVMSL